MGDSQSQLSAEAIAAATTPQGSQGPSVLSVETVNHFVNNCPGTASVLAGSQNGGGGGGGSGRGVEGAAEPALLSQLVILLGARPRNSLLLSDLGALLPQSLRHGVKERGGLRSWLQRYPELFTVSGSPGKESVTLMLGPQGSHVEATTSQGQTDVAATAGEAQSLEDDENDSAVQLRGLPYKASLADIRAFLGPHVENLRDQTSSVQLVLNRDGRPSGFARVQFDNPQSALACKEALHNQYMEVASDPASGGQRYVEVFLFSERPNKLRFKKNITSDDQLPRGQVTNISENGPEEGENLGVTKEDVIQQCRVHMNQPGQHSLLLSMLGVALSGPARAWLKKTDQGLKHFLSQYPNDFSVAGAKGREIITYLPNAPSEAVEAATSQETNNAAAAAAAGNGASTPVASAGHGFPQHFQPTTVGGRKPNRVQDSNYVPKSPTPHQIQLDAPGETPRGVNTPSMWGTPTPDYWHSQALMDMNIGTQPGGPSGANAAATGPDNSDFASAAVAVDAAAAASLMQTPDGYPDLSSAFGHTPDAMLYPGVGMHPSMMAPNYQAWGLPNPPSMSGAHSNPWGAWPDFGGGAGFPNPMVEYFQSAMAGGHPDFASLRAAAAGQVPAQTRPAEAKPAPEVVEAIPAAEIRLRGLPFTAEVQDVMTFLARFDIADTICDDSDAVRLVNKNNGKPSGQAIVKMLSRADAMDAVQKLNGQYLGHRFIEVFMNPPETQSTAQTAAAPTATATAPAAAATTTPSPAPASLLSLAAAVAPPAAAATTAAAGTSPATVATGSGATGVGGGSATTEAGGTEAGAGDTGGSGGLNMAALSRYQAAIANQGLARAGGMSGPAGSTDDPQAQDGAAWEALFGFLKTGEGISEARLPPAFTNGGGLEAPNPNKNSGLQPGTTL
mmetsp:Transcript_68370/g.142924  ORF Transcript_68370/g.142924 Transcript_68370/m.142924 type:complete len:901 (-) Transcript_68370:270-2972(-)